MTTAATFPVMAMSTPVKVGLLDDDGDMFDDPRLALAQSATSVSGTLRFGLADDDDFIDEQAILNQAPAFADPDADRALGNAALKDKPLTLEDLGGSGSDSRIASAASYVPMQNIPSRSSSASTSRLIDPSYVGFVSTRKIQAVKRDHSQSFSATSSSAHSSTRPSTDVTAGQSPAKRVKVSPFMSDQTEPTDTRSVHLFGDATYADNFDMDHDAQDTHDECDNDCDTFGPKRTSLLIDIEKHPSIYISSSRAAPFLFGPRGITAQIASPDPVPGPDGSIGFINSTLRSIVSIRRPSAIPMTSDKADDPTNVLSVLQRALVTAQPATPFSIKSGIALRTLAKVNRFSFSQAATFLPPASPAHTLLDLLGVMFDPTLDATASSLDALTIDASTACSDADLLILPQALVTLKSKAYLQKWLSTYLAPTATSAANHHLAQGGSPLHAILILVKSRQIGAACAMAMRMGYPRLSLVLSSAPANPARAQAHVRDVMQHAGTDPDYVHIVQLVALGPIDGAGATLPAWAAQALKGLSVSQALAHLLAAYPLLKVPEVVRKLSQFEHVLAAAVPASIDEVVMEVVMVATIPKQAGDYVRGLIKATIKKMGNPVAVEEEHVVELVGMTVALAGLVAHGVQVHAGDYAKVLVRTAAKLEQVGKWHMAALVLQVLALIPDQEQANDQVAQQRVVAQRNRALLSLIARNTAGGSSGGHFDTTAAATGKQALRYLTKQEQFVVEVLDVPVELVLEAKAMAVSIHAASSTYATGVHKLPIPPSLALGASSNRQAGQDLFPSLGTSAAATKVRIAHRPVRCKSQAERALEYARVLELVSSAKPFPFSTGAIKLAQTAVRRLIHFYVLENNTPAILDAVAKFEVLVDQARKLGMWVASVEGVRPAVVTAAMRYCEMLAADQAPQASGNGGNVAGNEAEVAMRCTAEKLVSMLSEMAVQRGDEWDDVESTAIFAMISKLTGQYGIGRPLRIHVPNLSLDI